MIFNIQTLLCLAVSVHSLAISKRPQRGNSNRLGRNNPTTNSIAPPNAIANVATNANAGAADSSALPNGISKIEQSPTSDYCRQFLNGRVVEANGTQLKQGGQSCSSTPMGQVVDANKILSTLITSPAYGATFDASINNTVTIDNRNLVAGFFNNPNTEYYMVPQTLDPKTGEIQGHQHITMQLLNNNAPPDPKVFAFFKGVNDAETDPDKRQLKAAIPAGTIKTDGQYRICTISGSDGHQSALSPMVKRGAQDDCIRVTVVNSDNSNNQKIADDSAQNVQITVDGKNSGRAATHDNSGTTGIGENLNQQVANKVKNVAVDNQAAKVMQTVAKAVNADGSNPNDLKSVLAAVGKTIGRNNGRNDGRNTGRNDGRTGERNNGNAPNNGKNANQNGQNNGRNNATVTSSVISPVASSTVTGNATTNQSTNSTTANQSTNSTTTISILASTATSISGSNRTIANTIQNSVVITTPTGSIPSPDNAQASNKPLGGQVRTQPTSTTAKGDNKSGKQGGRNQITRPTAAIPTQPTSKTNNQGKNDGRVTPADNGPTPPVRGNVPANSSRSPAQQPNPKQQKGQRPGNTSQQNLPKQVPKASTEKKGQSKVSQSAKGKVGPTIQDRQTPSGKAGSKTTESQKSAGRNVERQSVGKGQDQAKAQQKNDNTRSNQSISNQPKGGKNSNEKQSVKTVPNTTTKPVDTGKRNPSTGQGQNQIGSSKPAKSVKNQNANQNNPSKEQKTSSRAIQDKGKSKQIQSKSPSSKSTQPKN
ncbi:hypothetical protein BC833DRAFT_548892 [Globomyces pollinis-pini]|nr:hypothetical protein BC833DRAFT_548892 [Globomyces pollinis-pini]